MSRSATGAVGRVAERFAGDVNHTQDASLSVARSRRPSARGGKPDRLPRESGSLDSLSTPARRRSDVARAADRRKLDHGAPQRERKSIKPLCAAPAIEPIAVPWEV